jgi:hypothetical protein
MQTTNTLDRLDYFIKYLTPSEDEKKLFGEVFTPIPLIEEMLDKLPEEVWTNPDLKWLDPKHLYFDVINYFIYTWCLTHNQQNRIPLLFDYVLIPTYINREKEHQFFKQISFEEFFEFLVAIKNTDNKLMYEKRKKKK